MRNVNIFRTHVTDHVIPSEIMRRAIVLSPGKDWTDQKTDAYKYLKRWALEQDKRYPPKEEIKEHVEITDKIRDDLMNNVTVRFEGHDIKKSVISDAMKLSPGKDINDKRTKAYKYLKKWVLEQDNNENS